MLCLKVERFLCYWSLEVGGLILGWLTALGFLATFCFLGTLAFYGWFLGGVIQPNEDMWQALNMSNLNISRLKAFTLINSFVFLHIYLLSIEK